MTASTSGMQAGSLQDREARRRPSAAIGVLLALVLLLAACNGGGGSNSGGATPTSQVTQSNSGPGGTSVTPGISLGPQSCPNAVKDPAHWDQIIPTQPNVSKVESVSCGYLTGTPTLQALIMVRYNGTGSVLDVYVYNAIESPTPKQLFKLQNLYKGDARISMRNTVMTAEVDQNSSVNSRKNDATFTQDLYREFNTASFAPISFAGLYPDMTRFQGELDQARVNGGQDTWKLSAGQVAAHFATDPNLLNWSNVNGNVTSGGGAGDASAVVTISSAVPGTRTITLTMQRLEGNTNGGIWEVVGVASNGLVITTPTSRDILTSPITASGSDSAFAGTTGTLVVLDHTYTSIGHAAAKSVSNANTTFSASIRYTSTFKTGMQDGIVVFYAANTAGGPFAAAVMEKELI